MTAGAAALLIAGGEQEKPGSSPLPNSFAAEANLPLDALRIGHLDSDLYNPRCA